MCCCTSLHQVPGVETGTALPHAACAGVAGHAHRQWGSDYIERAVVTRAVSLAMLGLAILMAIWAGNSPFCPIIHRDCPMKPNEGMKLIPWPHPGCLSGRG